jgi:hypothetical protein
MVNLGIGCCVKIDHVKISNFKSGNIFLNAQKCSRKSMFIGFEFDGRT